MRSFSIGENDAGQRTDKFLMKACPKLPPSLLYKTFRKRDVKVNGKRVPPETQLAAGDTLQVYLPDDCFTLAPNKHASPAITLPPPLYVFEDDAIAIVQKPVDLPVHADDKGSTDTLAGRFLQDLIRRGAYDSAREQSFAPALCNRLDRNTEGLVIGAKTASALRCMNEKIRLREIEKEYLCITAGVPPKQSDTIHAYHRSLEGKKAEISAQPREGFLPICTGYTLLCKHDGISLLRVRLHTGRKHQIRAQLAVIGCPVLGDSKYGNRDVNRAYGVKYQMLAASSLTFRFSEEPCVLSYLNGLHREYTPDFCAKFGFSL